MRTPVAVCWVVALIALASPKSATLIRPSSAMSTFSGLTSRWIRPARCADASAETTGSSSARVRAGGERRLLADRVAQGVAGDQLHGQEDGAVVVALVEDRDHVGVRELRGGAGLGHEAGRELVVVAQPGVHHLDRDGAVEAQVGGLVDGGHAAAGDPRPDQVAVVEDPAGEVVGRLSWAGSLACWSAPWGACRSDVTATSCTRTGKDPDAPSYGSAADIGISDAPGEPWRPAAPRGCAGVRPGASMGA